MSNLETIGLKNSSDCQIVFLIQLFPNWTACSAITYIDCEQSLFCSKIRGEKEADHESRASSKAASSARDGRRAKRETAMVSYNDCEARHSGDGVILLVDDDAQLSAIFISDMRGEFEPYFAVLEIKESA